MRDEIICFSKGLDVGKIKDLMLNDLFLGSESLSREASTLGVISLPFIWSRSDAENCSFNSFISCTRLFRAQH